MLRALALALLVPLAGYLLPGWAAPTPTPTPAGIKYVTAVEGVTEFRLDNGLQVLMVPDPSIDTTTVNVTYIVGSRNEGYGETGMAHLLEHLMFRGTPHHPNIKSELTQRGARYNGTTSLDRTNYFETFPATEGNLDWALDIESDRMVNAFIAKRDLDAEMTVVRNEFESGENSPFNVLRERVAATAYIWHNYGNAIIGARADIENVPIERLQAFYRHYYQPDNAALIVSGRFDESLLLNSIAKHFGRIPKPTRALRKTYTVEPTQDGERSVTLRRAGNVQLVSALYHIPPGSNSDYPAVDVLVSLLSNVPGGRLQKALVESGKASSVFGSERQQREAGYAYFGASVRQGLSLQDARDALTATLEGLRSKPVTEEEVAQARMRLLNDVELTLADSRSLALTLSDAVSMGDWRLLYVYRDQMKKVTAADVQRVALAYMKPSNRTMGMFIPTNQPDRAEIPPVPDVAAIVRGYRGKEQVAQGEFFDPSPQAIESRVIRRTLPGGMKLALLPKKTRGRTVVADLSLHWGDEQSKEGRSTACGLASAMLMRGTQKKSREQIANEFSRLKASVGIGGDGASIETVRENLPESLRLVAEVLRHPSFPEKEFEQLRRAALTGLDAQHNDPGALAGIELTRHLNPYPPAHWNYTATLEDRAARLKALDLESVERCYNDFFGASNSEMAVVGDFDPDEITKLAQDLFGDWKSPHAYKRVSARYFDVSPIDRTIETPDKANAVFRAAMNLKLRDDDPDFPALVLGNFLLGGGSDSRLSRRIREREGLSYSVGSFLSADSFDARGVFGVYAIYAPENRARVESAVTEEIRRALADGFTRDEVENAKRGLLESRRISRTQDGSLAGRLLSYLVLDRSLRWDIEFERKIASLAPKEIVEALGRHIDPAKFSVVKAGEFIKGGEQRPPAPSKSSGYGSGS